MPIYFDRQGNPIDMLQWGILHDDLDYIVVEKTPLMYHDEPVEVSTVWIGLDLSYHTLERPPEIFETMVFGGPFDQECYRYSTEKEARDGHAMIVHAIVNQSSKERRDLGNADD